MKLLKELSYTNILERKMLYVNGFISICVLVAIYFDFAHLLFTYNIYGTTTKVLFITAVSAGLLGNIAGIFLFGRYSSRKIYIITDSILFVIMITILIRDIVNNIGNNVINLLLFTNEIYIPALLSILPLLLGLKIHYFMKISSGNFIDDKKGVIALLVTFFTGALAGTGLFVLFNYFSEYTYLSALLLIAVFPTIFIIKLQYTLLPQYTQEQKEVTDDNGDELKVKHDVLFTFLNISFILIYTFLGYKIIEKYYGSMLHIQIIFILINIICILIGFIIAKFVKTRLWYIYCEILFPISFLIFIACASSDYNNILFNKIFFHAIPATVFGFSLYKSIIIITSHYEQGKSFNILNYSLFIFPIPIIITLSLVEFTSLLFYSFLFIIMLISMLLPGIYLFQNTIDRYKKIIYYLSLLLFIPGIFIFYRYFNITFNNDLLIKHVSGFQQLYGNIINSLFITNNNEIFSHDKIVFINNDGSIRNLKKIILPMQLFLNMDNIESNILLIDGNYKYFRNPSFKLFQNYKVLDYVPERYVDYKSLPITAELKNKVEINSIYTFIHNKKDKYNIIIDIPNIMDQDYYTFRYSKKYYEHCKNIINTDGIFAQIYNLNNIKNNIINYSWNNLKNIFSNIIGFQCADQIILIASSDKNRLSINLNNYKTIDNIINNNDDIKYLFYNADHLLSHCIYSNNDDVKIDKYYLYNTHFSNYFCKSKSINMNHNFDKYYESGLECISLLSIANDNGALKKTVNINISKNLEVFKLLKKSEVFAVKREFENEAEILNIILNKFNYRDDIIKYMKKILSMKKEFYYTTAIELEKEKKWDEAKILYSALLKIDDSHFDANYKMGLLYITLQNINDALIHMKKAMVLKNDDPRVQYQMGVLLYSSGKAQEALKYLERAVELKQQSGSLYLYLGYCQEEIGRLIDAKNYYQKAIMIDPNDSNIKLSIDRVNNKIQEEINKWKTKDPENQNEAEQGENIPLPINKSAYEWRITDQEAKKLKEKE